MPASRHIMSGGWLGATCLSTPTCRQFATVSTKVDACRCYRIATIPVTLYIRCRVAHLHNLSVSHRSFDSWSPGTCDSQGSQICKQTAHIFFTLRMLRQTIWASAGQRRQPLAVRDPRCCHAGTRPSGARPRFACAQSVQQRRRVAVRFTQQEQEQRQPEPAGAPAAAGTASPRASPRALMLAVDDSDDSEYAVSFAVQHLLQPGDTVHVVHCVPTLPPSRMFALRSGKLLWRSAPARMRPPTPALP